MAEIGLDISAQFPKPLTTGKVQAADIVTGEQLPFGGATIRLPRDGGCGE